MRRRRFVAGVGAVITAVSGCAGQDGTLAEQDSNTRSCSNGGDLRPCVSLSHSPTKPTVGQSVVFDAGESWSRNNNTLMYFWRLGKRTTMSLPEDAVYIAEGPQYAHTYEKKGQHTVEVVVTPANNVTYDAPESFPNLEYGPDDPRNVTRVSDVVDVQELQAKELNVRQSDISIQLKANHQSVPVGDSAILSLSVANLIGGPTLSAQLILQIPSGLTVNGTSFSSGGGQFTSTYTVAPGESTTDVLRITAQESGPYLVSGYVVYTFEDPDQKRQKTEKSEIKIRFYE